MGYYQYHVFFCTNQREGGAKCCNDCGAQALRDYAKQRIKSLKLAGRNKIRINNAGCLDRCEEGPSVVVYPDGKWFKIETEEQVVEFIRETLIEGKTSTHLSMKE